MAKKLKVRRSKFGVQDQNSFLTTRFSILPFHLPIFPSSGVNRSNYF